MLLGLVPASFWIGDIIFLSCLVHSASEKLNKGICFVFTVCLLFITFIEINQYQYRA